MKNYLINALVLILLIIFRLTIDIFFPSFKLIPDFILIYVVIRAIIYGAKDAMFHGAVGGLLQDVFTSSFIGLFMPIKIIIAFLASVFSSRFFPENMLIPPAAVFLATIAHELLYLLLKENYLFTADYLALFREIILPLALLNAVLAFFVYFIYFYWGRRGTNG